MSTSARGGWVVSYEHGRGCERAEGAEVGTGSQGSPWECVLAGSAVGGRGRTA